MMEGDATMVRIDRKSSIENEPRTLTMDQIQYAREAALYVLNTRSIGEALSIFTEGRSQPVGSEARRNGDTMMDTSRQTQYLEDDDDDLRLPEIRDISSAPF